MNTGEESKCRTSVYRRDFPGTLDVLQFRIRFKLESLQKGKALPETKDQLEWALAVLEEESAWPAESDLRDEFLRLERAYSTAVR